MWTKKSLFLLICVAALPLSACGGGEEPAPTVDVAQVQTMAVAAYQLELTQTAMVFPTATPLPSQTSTPVATFGVSGEGTPATPLGSPTAAVVGVNPCLGLTYVKDVTIPDYTDMTQGQTFTKTWLVQNSGTCAWEPGFRFNVVGGDSMSGVAVTLNQEVQPGRQYEFSVPMVAPDDVTGEVKGTWRLSDANGNFFGDGVYVLIQIGGAAASDTPTFTPTP